MIDNKINRLNENNQSLIDYDSKFLIELIKTNILNNMDILNESYLHEYNDTLDKNRFINCFDFVNVEEETYKNELGLVSNTYSPYGVVGLIIKNNISLYNLASILCLIIQSKNSLIIELNKAIGTSNILIEIINKVLKSQKLNEIIISNNISKSNNFDLLLFIGSKEEFNSLNNTCLKRYYGIGNYELIVDKIIDKELISVAEKNNVKIINKNDDKYFYNNFNKESSNYCVGLMTDSKKEASVFLNSVKASFLLVNMIPTVESRINISYYDLVYRKSSIVYDKI